MNAETSELKGRRNVWLVIEKIIGWILLLWSMFVLYNVIITIANMLSSHMVVQGKITYSNIVIKNHLTIIISLLCLFGSCWLLFKDKTGWVLCVITSLIYGINLFISSRSKAIDATLPMANYYKSYGIVALVFLIIFFLLLLKPIRSRYQPTLKTWITIIATVLLLVIDNILF